jgi:hypothetical protein
MRKIAFAILGIALGLTIGFGTTPASPKAFRFDVNPVTRPINGTTFTPSMTANVEARYIVELSVTQVLSGQSSARVLLQFSEDNGSTWNDGEEAFYRSALPLGVVILETVYVRQTISCFVPRGSMVRLVTTIVGTATTSFQRGAENPY